jgi:hypothetical protein
MTLPFSSQRIEAVGFFLYSINITWLE